MIISTDAAKASDKNSTSFYDKNSSQSEHRKNILQHNKGHVWQTTGNIIINGEKLEDQEQNKDPFSPLSFSFNMEVAVLGTTIRKGKEIKGIEIKMERKK